VTGLAWVLLVWAVVGGGIVLWFADALAVLEGSTGGRPDRTSCAGCRHDEIAHRHDGGSDGCSQCPCPGFRRRG